MADEEHKGHDKPTIACSTHHYQQIREKNG